MEREGDRGHRVGKEWDAGTHPHTHVTWAELCTYALAPGRAAA